MITAWRSSSCKLGFFCPHPHRICFFINNCSTHHAEYSEPDGFRRCDLYGRGFKQAFSAPEIIFLLFRQPRKCYSTFRITGRVCLTCSVHGGTWLLSEAYPEESPPTSLWALFFTHSCLFQGHLAEHALNAGLSWAQALRTAPRHNRDKNGVPCLPPQV
jgi:hypothetical protein